MAKPSLRSAKIFFRETPEMQSAFYMLCALKETTPSKFLRQLVRHVVKAADIEVEDMIPLPSPEKKSVRLDVRLSKSELDRITPLAEPFGSVRDWIIAVLRSRLRPELPQFSTNEVKALYESNRELFAIGRNINQIAHAFNSDMLQSGRVQERKDQIEELRALKVQIAAHTALVNELCNASINRWGNE